MNSMKKSSTIWRPILRWPMPSSAMQSQARLSNRLFSNTPKTCESGITPTPSSSLQTQPPPTATTTSSTSSPFTQPPPTQLTYHVSRTPTNNLPVYSDFKGHRTLELTKVRKIAGNAHALRNELMELLGLNKETCYVSSPAMHVVMKGRHKMAVTKFLLSKGF